VSTAASPAATAAAFAAFLAVPLTFERVIAPERFLVFAALLDFALPRFAVFERFDDFFEERLDAFAMVPPNVERSCRYRLALSYLGCRHLAFLLSLA
jgi:hypothetical protein